MRCFFALGVFMFAFLSKGDSVLHQQTDTVSLKVFSGAEARKYVEDIARLRLTMFREYPYLYDGNLKEEKEYLEIYFKSKNSRVLLVFDGCDVVGFSNNIPLEEEMPEIAASFSEKGLTPSDYLYIGEVMLMPTYRHKGLARKFFEFHEQVARKMGRKLTLMTVERPDDHPLKPQNYVSLEPIWTHFGFQKFSDVKVLFPWPQVDAKEPVKNTLVFWHQGK